jgi:hypothetical protein
MPACMLDRARARQRTGVPRPQEDRPMLQTVYYPREIIAERVQFTPADHAQIARSWGP